MAGGKKPNFLSLDYASTKKLRYISTLSTQMTRKIGRLRVQNSKPDQVPENGTV
jgi:hypothetical protein